MLWESHIPSLFRFQLHYTWTKIIIFTFKFSNSHFTVIYGNEAGVDLVLIQTSLLSFANHVVFVLSSSLD